MVQRRSLLAAMLLAGTAPAVVRAGVLMPVRQIIMPAPLVMDLSFYGGWKYNLKRTDNGIMEWWEKDGLVCDIYINPLEQIMGPYR